MKKLLNTLYITNSDYYLIKEGENVVVKNDVEVIKRFPIHILENIVCFNYTGASSGVIKLCNENNVSLSMLSPNGSFCGRFCGKQNGNVLLRRMQYRIADNEVQSLLISKNMIIAKLNNTKKILSRLLRDHPLKVDEFKLKDVISRFEEHIKNIEIITNMDSLRGIEGEAAKRYFDCFNDLILQQKEEFRFNGRTKRPPMDNVNALLSFFYSILTVEITSSLEVVGLDSYVGFFHTDRPGRSSLSLDLIEEFRAYLVDRFVLSLINKKIITKNDFIYQENGSVLLNDKGRSKSLEAWQARKNEEIIHPFLKEKVKIGLLPYIQSCLLAKTIRFEIEEYPPFMI